MPTHTECASLEMGLCDMICRWWVQRKGAVEIRMVTRAAVAAILFGLIAVYVIMI